MPKRTDISSIMIIGAGPIVIGQACEFDYSGAQACKALREEGYRVILVNSNPATIMTDPGMADATYIEPITPEVVAKIIEKERPDALLPTMGGQTGLNTALAVADMGVLDKFGVELIGAKREAIEMAEDRKLFREAMDRIGLENPKATIAESLEECMAAIDHVGLPAIIRPAFTLGGTGGGVAYNRDDYEHFCKSGLDASPVTQILIDESLLGWKEYEMEVVRDKADNAIIVLRRAHDGCLGVFQPQPVHRLAKQLAVLGHFDGFAVGADQLDAEFVQNAHICHRQRGIEPGLSTHRGQQCVGAFLFDDFGHHLGGDGFDIGGVGQFRVGHDRGGVGIDQDHPVAFFAQRLAGLGAGIVEFAGLPDNNGSRPDNHDGRDVCSFRHGDPQGS